MKSAAVGAEWLLLAAAAYLMLFVVGWWLWDLAGGRVEAMSVAAGAPIAGLAVLVVVSWYAAGHVSLSAVSWPVVAAGALADIAVLAVRRPRIRIDRSSINALGGASAVAVVTAGLFEWNRLPVLRLGSLSAGSLFIADLPFYVREASALAAHGLMTHGNVVGFNISGSDNHYQGARALLAISSEVVGQTPFEDALPVMLLTVVLIALCARDLARVLLPAPAYGAEIVAVAAAGSSLVVYSIAHYPLAQALAMAAALELIAVTARVPLHHPTVTVRGSLSRVAICVISMLLIYPHMAVLSLPIALGVGLAMCWGPDWRRQASRVVGSLMGGVLVATVVIPNRVIFARDWLHELNDSAAGFALPLMTPFDVMGLRSSYPALSTGPAPVAVFVLETAVIGGLVALVMVLTSPPLRSRVLGAGAAALGTVGSYAVVYASQGASYRSWKWAAFFAPLLVVGVGVLLGYLALRGLRGRNATRRRAVVPAIALAVLLVLSVQAALAHASVERFVLRHQGESLEIEWSLVGRDLENIGTGAAWRGVREVNVRLGNWWEDSWAAHFLSPRRVRFQSAIWNSAEPASTWILERKDLPGIHPPGSVVRNINDTYRLVREENQDVSRGAAWIVGDCAGLYRFDGRRWIGVERTRSTGGYRLRLFPKVRPPGTVVPLLVRGGGGTVDALLFEYLRDGRARVVLEHRIPGMPRRRGLDLGRPRVVGAPFTMVPDRGLDLDVVFDPLNGEVAVRVAAEPVLSVDNPFFLPPPMAQTIVGRNAVGRNAVGANAERHFSGRLVELPASEATVCRSLATAGP